MTGTWPAIPRAPKKPNAWRESVKQSEERGRNKKMDNDSHIIRANCIKGRESRRFVLKMNKIHTSIGGKILLHT